MARRKHSAALFEVFNNEKKAKETRAGSIPRAPRWWSRPRVEPTNGATSAVMDANDPTTMKIVSPLLAPRLAAVEAMEPAPPPPAPAKPVPVKSAPPLLRSERVERDRVDPTRGGIASRSIFEPASKLFQFDRNQRDVKIHLKLTTLIVAGFGIVLLAGIAYIMGRRSTPAADTVVANHETLSTSDRPRKLPVQPNALDVGKRLTHTNTGNGTNRSVPRNADDARTRDRESGTALPMANTVHGLNPITSEAAGAVEGPRMIGLNYIIAQTFPNQQTAMDAHDFLVNNGIPCTVQKAPIGWTADPNWYSVISTRGFERIHTPECEALQRQIEKIGEKFAGNGKFKRFEPHLYRWR